DLDSLPVPSIIVVQEGHCIVYQGPAEDGERVRVFEPGSGRVMTPHRETILRAWNGEAIVFDGPRPSAAAFWLAAAAVALATALLTTGALRRWGARGRPQPAAGNSPSVRSEARR